MPKMRVERTTDYRLLAMIRGEMAAQGVTIERKRYSRAPWLPMSEVFRCHVP